MDERQKVALELTEFRSAMGCTLSETKAKYIWGKNFVKTGTLDLARERDNPSVDRKVDIVKADVKYLLVSDWVRFIGISGSVAAGFASEDDDIDLFIVVKDDCAWIYRGILAIRNLFHNRIRAKRHGNDVKDKLCINLVCEERGLGFENDMFNFHELMYLIPIYNERYLNYIFLQNKWLKQAYFVKNDLFVTREVRKKRAPILIRILNRISFFAQLLFMIMFKHSPEIDRLRNGFRVGKIEFFNPKYKEKKLENYSKIV